MEVDFPTKFRVLLSFHCPFSLLSFHPLCSYFHSCALAILPVLVSNMNFLPFVSLSFLEREGKFGLLCLCCLIPLHRAIGSSYYHCPYAQIQHLSSAQEDIGRVAASSSELSFISCCPLCVLPGQQEKREEGIMAHTTSSTDWRGNLADAGQSAEAAKPPHPGKC